MNKALTAAITITVFLSLTPGVNSLTSIPDDEMTFYQDVAWSPDGKTLATSAMRLSRSLWQKEQFGAFRKSQYDIYVIAADGSREVRITESPENDLWVAWWPGGHCLLYSAERSSSSGLLFIKTDGSNPQALRGLPGHVTQPSVSPDGKKIAFMSRQGTESHIYVISATGPDAPIKVTSTGPSNWNPAWSPDSKRILFFSNRLGRGRDQIFVANANGSNETQLTKDEFNNTFPSWSPNGKRIIFGSNREGKGKEGIFVMDSNGSNIRSLMPGVRAEFARWSPDGKKLAYISGDFPDMKIYIANADGSNPTRLTQ